MPSKTKEEMNLTGFRSPLFLTCNFLAVSKAWTTQGTEPSWPQQLLSGTERRGQESFVGCLVSQAQNNIPTLHVLSSVLMEVLFQM